MKCGHCGAGEPNVYRSDVFHPDYGFIKEWSCLKCGSRKIEREEKDMAAKIGTCEGCGRFLCGKCRSDLYKSKKSTLGAGNPPPSSPPPPLKEGADFPVIVLSFPTERDRTLYHAIRGNAASARNEKVDQHVLHLLEKALSLSA